MIWRQLTERDCREWKLSAIDPHDRDTWRSAVRSAMHAAGQLPGRGLTTWILPLYLHVNEKSGDDDTVCHLRLIALIFFRDKMQFPKLK